MMFYGGGGWGVLWMFVWWAFVIGVIYLIARAVTSGSRPDSGNQDRRPDAIARLDERFARGEIGEEEYLDRRRVLDAARGPSTPA